VPGTGCRTGANSVARSGFDHADAGDAIDNAGNHARAGSIDGRQTPGACRHDDTRESAERIRDGASGRAEAGFDNAGGPGNNAIDGEEGFVTARRARANHAESARLVD
jgi:hypothetical protein